MEKQITKIGRIPAIIWGEKSDKVFLHVHGKFSKKEYAEQFAKIAEGKGYQTVSFDLPQHGERRHNEEPIEKAYLFNVFNSLKDLKDMSDFVFSNWKNVNLFGNSFGAQISLQLFSDNKRHFNQVLFQSPIIDMNHLIQNMFVWFNVSEERLRKEKIVETELDTMTIEQFEFFRDNPIKNWNFNTSILFGAEDHMQTKELMEDFCKKYNANLTISEFSKHAFMEENDYEIFGKWLEKAIVN